ncbi:hypothetical protein RPMA_18005 [Tardiphaga alba]|uniref:Uncharacterized protein n=1 Tax=Tardiphaga alba TaxID=340268 RepID=A0ABX8ADY2_9BRAD|nr:hypothetical protein [Tardiphaga alba]QUS40515.1 hypothetical protein RPMA_18005 [Tardiphaga alba]
MKILFVKPVRAAEEEARKIPLPQKLLMIFRARVKDAETEDLREEAVRDLAKLEAKLGLK